MASIGKQDQHQQLGRDVLESAPGFILEYGIEGPWVDRVARHFGYSPRKLLAAFETKGELITFILERHLAEAFEAVCLPSDWFGAPVDVLRSMSLALIAYGADNLARHRVFLAEHERRPERARRVLAQQLVHLTNNFQVALHGVVPRRRFEGLQDAACMLLGQLLHAPLWWPREMGGKVTPALLDAWVCTQLGLLAGIRRPDHRLASRARLKAPAPEVMASPPSGAWRPETRAASAAGDGSLSAYLDLVAGP